MIKKKLFNGKKTIIKKTKISEQWIEIKIEYNSEASELTEYKSEYDSKRDMLQQLKKEFYEEHQIST